jgi:hypothetical protein
LRDKAAARAAPKATQASAITFEQAALYYIRDHENTWSNAKYAAQWLSNLKKCAFQFIGK